MDDSSKNTQLDSTILNEEKVDSSATSASASAIGNESDDIVIKDGKTYKRRATLPPLAEMLMHGAPGSTKKTSWDAFFGPAILGFSFFLSFLCFYHLVLKGTPLQGGPGMDLMKRIDAARDQSNRNMKAQLERAKELSSKKRSDSNQANGEF